MAGRYWSPGKMTNKKPPVSIVAISSWIKSDDYTDPGSHCALLASKTGWVKAALNRSWPTCNVLETTRDNSKQWKVLIIWFQLNHLMQEMEVSAHARGGYAPLLQCNNPKVQGLTAPLRLLPAIEAWSSKRQVRHKALVVGWCPTGRVEPKLLRIQVEIQRVYNKIQVIYLLQRITPQRNLNLSSYHGKNLANKDTVLPATGYTPPLVRKNRLGTGNRLRLRLKKGPGSGHPWSEQSPGSHRLRITKKVRGIRAAPRRTLHT